MTLGGLLTNANCNSSDGILKLMHKGSFYSLIYMDYFHKSIHKAVLFKDILTSSCLLDSSDNLSVQAPIEGGSEDKMTVHPVKV